MPAAPRALLRFLRPLAPAMAGLALALTPLPGLASPTAAAATACADSFLPVSLAPDQPADQQVFVEFCQPAGTTPSTVWVIHQIVQALRDGQVAGPSGPAAFSKVIEVSW